MKVWMLALALAACGSERVDSRGVGVWLTAIASDEARAIVVELEADGVRFEVGAAPTFRVIPNGESVVMRRTPFELAAGERRALEPVLVAWVPGVDTVDVGVRVIVDGVVVGETHAAIAGDERLRVGGTELTFVGEAVEARERIVGLHFDRGEALAVEAAAIEGPIGIKVYAGARRWLLRAGCDSDDACASGGANHPCVETCACDAERGDCDFAGLEATMEETALAAVARVGGDASRARIHWVFKRSLGGSAQCDVNGELDVSAETYGRFFEAAVDAAANINARHGTRLIDVLSPMNEANHPLQDGAHENAAGQPSIGGFLAFRDAIRQASCSGETCCATDRYVVASPDVPALLDAALARGGARARALEHAPRIGLSLYLDSDQVDPLQTDDAGEAPSIVTPVATFFERLAAPVDPLIVVDTYPGSWGAPWFESDDRIVHHMDPALARIVRVDPVAPADAVLTRATAAARVYERAFGIAPDVLLGEVGWSTFDGDEAAQATFVRRVFDRVAAEPDAKLLGFYWFKGHDRAAFAGYPTWSACADGLEAILCAAELFTTMEGQWGLRRVDDSPKPAWRAFVDRWARLRAAR